MKSSFARRRSSRATVILSCISGAQLPIPFTITPTNGCCSDSYGELLPLSRARPLCRRVDVICMNQPAGISSNELRDSTNFASTSMATQIYPPPRSATQFFHTPSSRPKSSPKSGHIGPIETPSCLRQQDPVATLRSESHVEADSVNQSSPPSSSSERPTEILDIAEHSQSELLAMLSSLLTKITTTNDSLHSGSSHANPPKPGSPLLAFHARNIPSISIQSYLTRILKYCPMSSDIFLSLLVYFDRMSRVPTPDSPTIAQQSTFTSTKQLMGNEHHPFSIDSYNVHRLVITGIVVASKFCSDVFYTNSRYAKVSHNRTIFRHLKLTYTRWEVCRCLN